MGPVSNILICSYFMPSDSVDSDSDDIPSSPKSGQAEANRLNEDKVVNSGAHIYCLQMEDECESHPVIQQLFEKNFTIVKADNNLAFLAFDNDRFTICPETSTRGFNKAAAVIQHNETGRKLLVASIRKSGFSPVIGTASTAIVYAPISLLKSGCSLEFTTPRSGGPIISEIPEGFKQLGGGLLQFKPGPEEQPSSVLEHFFSVAASIVTFVQSIFMTTYGKPAYTLETQPSPDGSRQPLMTKIAFPKHSSLIHRIGEWFMRMFGCGSQGQELIQTPN